MHKWMLNISHFVTHYDWLAKSLAILVGMLIFHWLSRRIYHFLVARFDNGRHVWLVSFIKSVHAPWMTFFWLFAISFIIPDIILQFHIDIRYSPVMNQLRSLFFISAFYWSIMQFIKKLERVIAPRWGYSTSRDKTTVRAVAQLSRVVATVLFVLSVLPVLHFPTSSLLAFGGAGGLGVAFAGKEMLSNFFGGMMIFLDRPFSVGDWICSPDRHIEGTVEYIGWRLTRIRTFDKRPLYVPNSVFSTVAIENPSRMTNRRIDALIGVRYDDANQIESIVKDIDKMLHENDSIDGTQSIMVHFTQFAPSSLNINVYAFTKTTDWAKYREVQQDVFLKIIGIITAHGAECAFPTTTMLSPEPVEIVQSAGDANNDRRSGES